MIQPQPTDGFEWTQAPWGRVLRCRPLLEVADHFFTDRALELREDREEWRQVAQLAGVDEDALQLLKQVHGNRVVLAGTPPTDRASRPEADAAISGDPGSAVVVRVADCAPILLADRRRGIVGAVHAGWRSTMQRIAVEAVEALRSHFGSDPADLVAAVGPSLGKCCGEMGEEVVEAFRASGHPARDIDRWFDRTPGRRPHFDLWRANADQLERAGVPPRSIHVAGLCTKTFSRELHSYRAAGAGAGRMAAVIRARGHRHAQHAFRAVGGFVRDGS